MTSSLVVLRGVLARLTELEGAIAVALGGGVSLVVAALRFRRRVLVITRVDDGRT